MSNRRKVRRVRAALSRDTAVPVIAPAEVPAFLSGRVGGFMLHHSHAAYCPAGRNGTGRGCICVPDVSLRDHQGRKLAEVKA